MLQVVVLLHKKKASVAVSLLALHIVFSQRISLSYLFTNMVTSYKLHNFDNIMRLLYRFDEQGEAPVCCIFIPSTVVKIQVTGQDEILQVIKS